MIFDLFLHPNAEHRDEENEDGNIYTLYLITYTLIPLYPNYLITKLPIPLMRFQPVVTHSDIHFYGNG